MSETQIAEILSYIEAMHDLDMQAVADEMEMDMEIGWDQ